MLIEQLASPSCVLVEEQRPRRGGIATGTRVLVEMVTGVRVLVEIATCARVLVECCCLVPGAWCREPGAWCLVHGAWRRSQIQLQSQIQIQHPKSADMNRPVFRVGINWNQAGSVSNPSVYEIGIAVCITMQVSRQCQFPWVCGLTYLPSTHHPESSRRGPIMVAAPRQRRKITDTDFMGL